MLVTRLAWHRATRQDGLSQQHVDAIHGIDYIRSFLLTELAAQTARHHELEPPRLPPFSKSRASLISRRILPAPRGPFARVVALEAELTLLVSTLLTAPPREMGRVLRAGVSAAAAARMLSLSAAAERLDEAAEDRRAAAAWVLASASCETALSICAVAASERPPMVRPRASHRCVKDIERGPLAVELIAPTALRRSAGSPGTPRVLPSFEPGRESNRDSRCRGGIGSGRCASAPVAALTPGPLRVGKVDVWDSTCTTAGMGVDVALQRAAAGASASIRAATSPARVRELVL